MAQLSDQDREAIGRRINRARKEAGLTQPELGKLCGGSKQLVNNWEKGRSAPDIYNILQLEDATGFSARWITTGKGPETAVQAKDLDIEPILDGLSDSQLALVLAKIAGILNR